MLIKKYTLYILYMDNPERRIDGIDSILTRLLTRVNTRSLENRLDTMDDRLDRMLTPR